MRRTYIPGHNNNRHLTNEELENNIGGIVISDGRLRELFDQYDVSRSGKLDFNEVKKIYKSFENYGVELSDKEVEEEIRKFSKGSDNLVTFDEFSCLILHIAQR